MSRIRSRSNVVARTLVSALLLATLLLAAPSSPGAAQVDEFEAYAARSDLSEGHADVFRLYWAFFDRQPDVVGARYWAGQYEDCTSLLDITWSFGHSAEFERRYSDLTDSEYVWLVYRNVLDREPDPIGEAYWLELLNDGELIRSEIMLYFSQSAEFETQHPLPSDGRPFEGCSPGSTTP